MIVDSLCVTSWRARPVSFVSLMTLYESNYIRLRALVGDVRAARGRRACRATPGDLDLHVAGGRAQPLHDHPAPDLPVRGEPTGPVADPDLEVRVYHDARLAEASRCARWVRHPGPRSELRAGLPSALGERWLRNMLLNKWLDYCARARSPVRDGRRSAPGAA